jgi:hypothetical protein
MIASPLETRTTSLDTVLLVEDNKDYRSHLSERLARPGGNLTGVFTRQAELAEKQVGLHCGDADTADQFSAAERRVRALGRR